MNSKKKFLIIFFSILFGQIIIISAIFIYSNYWYRQIDKIVEKIDAASNFLFYNDFIIVYNGEEHLIHQYENLENVDIEYVDDKCLIYSKGIKYYLYDDGKNDTLIYISDNYRFIDAFQENVLYMHYLNKYFAYNTISKCEVELNAEEFYSKVYATKYVLKYDVPGYSITDTTTNVSRKISFDEISNNEIIKNINAKRKKVHSSDIEIRTIIFVKDDIYIMILPYSVDKEAIMIKYDFELRTVEIIGKFPGIVSVRGEAFYLEDNFSIPVEKIIRNK